MSVEDYRALIQGALASGQIQAARPSFESLSQLQQNEEIARQIAERTDTAGGPSIFERGMNVFGRVLDVASRPLYSVAEATQSAWEGEDILQGVWEGFSGQEKTTFSDVLETAGVDNNLARGLGGFALDVAFDPLTYLGGGVVRRAASEAAEHTGARAAQRFFNTKEASKIFNKAEVDVLRQGTLATAGKAGAKYTMLEPGIQEAAAKAARDAVNNAAMERAIVVRNKAAAKEAGKVQLKLRLPGFERVLGESETLYDIGSKVGNRLGKTEVGRNLNRMFRPAATWGKDLNDLKRRIESRGMNWLENAQTQTHDIFRELGDTDTQTLFNAITTGDKSFLAPDMAVKGQQARDLSDQMFNIGVGLDINRADRYVDDYWYPVFKQSDPDDVIAEFRKLRDKELNKLFKANDELVKKGLDPLPVKSSYGPDKAREMGLNPVEDIEISLHHQFAKHNRQATRAKFHDAAGINFGLKLPEGFAKKWGWKQTNIKRLEGTYFPRETAEALNQVNKLFTDEAAGAGLLRLYDKALGGLKFSQTVANPGHHVRNSFGDGLLNWLNGLGLTRSKFYDDAGSILKGSDRYNPELEWISPNVSSKPANNQIYKFKNLEMTGDRVLQEYIRSGGKTAMTTAEHGRQGYMGKVRQISEKREDLFRLANWMHSFDEEIPNVVKPTAKQINEAANRAGSRVRKFNIDYGDLTPFEKNVMKRTIPFYTWLRKNTPLQIEALFMQPGKQMVFPKALRAAQEVLGTEGEPSLNGVGILPQWMKDTFRIGVGDETFFDPRIFPFYSLNDLFGPEPTETGIPSPGNAIQNLLSQSSFAIQAPIEAATGQRLFTGRPVNATTAEYASGFIPATRILEDWATGEDIKYPIINALTGAGLSELQPEQIAGELQNKKDIVDAIIQAMRARGELPERGGVVSPEQQAMIDSILQRMRERGARV